jgi:hypothetical protein
MWVNQGQRRHLTNCPPCRAGFYDFMMTGRLAPDMKLTKRDWNPPSRGARTAKGSGEPAIVTCDHDAAPAQIAGRVLSSGVADPAGT